MMKRKISTILAITMLTSCVTPAIHVFADNKVNEVINAISQEINASRFGIVNSAELPKYDKMYKAPIKSISNNGGRYSNSIIENAIDGKLNTHWETGKPNTSTFTNEVVVELENTEKIDRVVYAARRDAGGKGFSRNLEIYASESGDDADFQLLGNGKYSSNGDVVEYKFDTVNAKKFKFVMKEANQDWASASEFWFYKEDKVITELANLFTDSKKNVLNEKYNTLEKLEALENKAKSHVLYDVFKSDFQDAKDILNSGEVAYMDAVISKFEKTSQEQQKAYDKEYLVPTKKITTNGGHYDGSVIERAADGDLATNWHSGKQNNGSFKNEVVLELDKLSEIDRIIFGAARGTHRGFPEKFEVYVSPTTSGNNFELVSKGGTSATQDVLEFKFNPTKAKRVKFIFAQGYENWAEIGEIGVYTTDSIREKMTTLFTDAGKSTVSEAYNTVEKLDALENEVKNHPLYSLYKEDLDNARIIIGDTELEVVKASTKVFDKYKVKGYDELFKMDKSNIKSIKNNAGAYAGQVIDKAIDGKLDTYWETNTSNTSTFNNTIEVTFKDKVVLDRVVTGARASDSKGFANEFEIYGSKTSTGDTYKLVSTGTHNKTGGVIEVKFQPTEFKRMKFVYKKSDQNWATASELWFYSKDEVADTINSIFTDGTQSKVKDGVTLETIGELEEQLKTHPLKNELKEVLELAREVLENPAKHDSAVWEVPARGDSIHESQKRKVWNFQDWQPTGYMAKPGDVIEVYVDVEDGAPTPQLVYKQMDSAHNGQIHIPLREGKNIITVPGVPKKDIRPGTTTGGPLYTVNPNDPAKQGSVPKMRIKGAKQYPHFIKGVDNNAEVMAELEAYVDEIKKDPTIPDVFDVFSDKTLSNVRATYAIDYYKKNSGGQNPAKTADKQDDVLKKTMDYWGFDDSSEVNSDFNFRYVQMIKYLDGGGFMNAGNGITGINQNEQGAILGVDTGWGTMHELGHNFDTNNRAIGETTNNMLPQWFRYLKGNSSRITEQGLWESWIFRTVVSNEDDINEWYPKNDQSKLTHLTPLWQLQIYDNDFWPKFERNFRESKFGGGDMKTKENAWVAYASDAMELDLVEFFERHGAIIHEETKAYCSKYEKPDKKLWYINDKIYADKKYEAFSKDVSYEISKTEIKDNTVKLSFNMDADNLGRTLGYEIYRDGELIGFTAEQSFTDKSPVAGTNHEYKIVAYDKQVNPVGEAYRKLYTPEIAADESISVELNSTFDPMKYVVAKSYSGTNIDSKVKVTANNVDTSSRGDYEVTYKVEDEGITQTVTTKISVVSKINYVSDLDAVSTKVGWGRFQKDKAPNETPIELTKLGNVTRYDKGIGAHADSEVVYNVEGKGYDFFESFLGVDYSMIVNNNSSATFEVHVDGKKVYDSGVMNASQDRKYVKIDIRGAKEVKLITTDGKHNGQSADQTVWADAKFTQSSTKPELKGVTNKIAKLNEEFDLLEGVTAKDIEDGDITDKVVVHANGFDVKKPGTYNVGYIVTDSENNTTSKTVKVSVYNEEVYASDMEYTAGNPGWGAIRNDKAADNTDISLLGKDGQEQIFEKGIGAHANSEIRFNVEGKNILAFKATLGIDDHSRGYNESSAKYIIKADNKVVYESKVFGGDTVMEDITVCIPEGTKEIKLITDEYNNKNWGDQTVWADAMFIGIKATDKAELEATLKVADSKVELDYTAETWAVFADAKAKATVVFEDTKTVQEEIDNALAELNKSIEGLKIDSRLLESKLAELEKLDASLYTKESWEALQVEVVKAKVLISNGASRVELDKALEDLTKVESELVLLVDKTLLKEVLDKANAMTKDMATTNKHLEPKWNNFVESRKMAEVVLEDKNATKAHVTKAINMLVYCAEELGYYYDKSSY